MVAILDLAIFFPWTSIKVPKKNQLIRLGQDAKGSDKMTLFDGKALTLEVGQPQWREIETLIHSKRLKAPRLMASAE